MPQGPLSALVSIFAGKFAPIKLGAAAATLLTDDLHGIKYEQTFANNMFVGANPSGVTTSAGLATTYVGLCLSNPAGSTVNLVLRRIGGALIVAPAALTGFNLITGFAAGGITAHTTALTPFCAKIGNAAVPQGKLDSACTLVGTPVYTRVLTETPSATGVVSFFEDMQSGIILIPGAYAAIGTTIAGPASGFQGSIEWEEVPVAG